MNIIAWDTETTLIPDRRSVSTKSTTKEPTSNGGSVAVEPFQVPELILGSITDQQDSYVVEPDVLFAVLQHELKEAHVVVHNISFDYWVVVNRFPELKPLLDKAAEEGRLHDTMILDTLYRLSIGYFDKPQFNPGSRKWNKPDVRSRGLDDLAKEYADITLTKDARIRLGFAEFKGRPLAQIPKEFLHYAKMDAVATYKVFMRLKELLERDHRENWLSESIQVQAAIALATLDRRGVRIDRRQAQKFLTQFESYQKPLQHQLVSAGLGRWAPFGKPTRTHLAPSQAQSGSQQNWVLQGNGMLQKYKQYKNHSVLFEVPAKFSLNTKVIQAELEKFKEKSPPRRADGTIGLEYDFWSQKIFDGPLKSWLDHEKLKKIVSTYLNLYSQVDEVYPRWYVIGARSGRMSASGPSIQNVPKRRYGIRSLFIPRPGHRFIKADYTAQEMYTLAEAMLSLSPPIKGPLYEVLTSGKDIHTFAASIVLRKPMEEVTKEERQGQKACSFGVPGGLGPKTLAGYAADTYGVKWTVEEAKKRRDAFLAAFPDIQEYLERQKIDQGTALEEVTGETIVDWKKNLGIQGWRVIDGMIRHPDPEIQRLGLKAERLCKVVLPTGRVRAFCRFTEAANSYFQGLAADVTKEALWMCFRFGLNSVLVVHDEIVIEALPDDVEFCADALRAAMLIGFKKVCPNLGHYAKVEVSGPLDRWGPATDPEGKVIEI